MYHDARFRESNYEIGICTGYKCETQTCCQKKAVAVMAKISLLTTIHALKDQDEI